MFRETSTFLTDLDAQCWKMPHVKYNGQTKGQTTLKWGKANEDASVLDSQFAPFEDDSQPFPATPVDGDSAGLPYNPEGYSPPPLLLLLLLLFLSYTITYTPVHNQYRVAN